MGGINFTNLLIIAVLVILLFGTKKLRTLGSDLGASIKGFKKAMGDDADKGKNDTQDADFNSRLAEKSSTEAKREDIKNDKV